MENSSNTNPYWFTNEFLEQILRTVDNDSTITITNSNVEDAAEKGAHYGSTMYRISINIARGRSVSEKKSIIIKLAPQRAIGDMVSRSTVFPREIKMFSQIIPTMNALLENVLPGEHKSFGAKHYYSESKLPYVLMLEDLSMSGFVLADRTVGLDLPHSVLVMKTLGRFHASSVVLYAEDPKMFDIFSESIFLESNAMDDMFTNMCHNGFKAAIKAIEKWENVGQAFAKKLTHCLETIMDDFKAAYKNNPNDFNVLIHGDLWVNNMMFCYNDATSEVTDMKLVDFQGCAISSPAVDLQYFIQTSVRDDIREHHTEELLKIYHDELVKTLTLLGYGDKAICFDDLVKVFETKAVIGFYWMIIGLPFMKGKRGEKQDLESMVKKDENNATVVTINKECETVWRRLLPGFEKKGLF